MAVISASSVISPVGQDSLQTFTSIRANITRKGVAKDLYICLPDDPDFETGEPPVVSSLSYLDDERKTIKKPAEWLAFLAATALWGLEPDEAMEVEDYATAGLFLSLPPAGPDGGPQSEEAFLYHFYNYAEKDPMPVQEIFCSGHAGALALFDSALCRLQEGKISRALIGGAESYLFRQRLHELDLAYRLKSSRNVDGFVPGECAAFVLLENDGMPEKRGLAAQVKIEKVACTQCGPEQMVNNTGVELSELIAGVLTGVDDAPVILCDLNGEPARMREWGYVLSRLGERLGNPCVVEHPADVLGDVGAASGVMLAALAPLYLTKKYPQKKRALIWTASDTGERSVVLMSVLK